MGTQCFASTDSSSNANKLHAFLRPIPFLLNILKYKPITIGTRHPAPSSAAPVGHLTNLNCIILNK